MIMKNIATIGALPTSNINNKSNNYDVNIYCINELYLRNQLLKNFLSLKSIEHTNSKNQLYKSKNTKTLVFQNIINKYINKNHGSIDSYKFKDGKKVHAEDLKQEALFIVWVATEKYLKSKDKNNISYIQKFENFNDFAVSYLNYKLKELVFKNNINQVFGKICDNAKTRKEYYCIDRKKNNSFTNKIIPFDSKIDNTTLTLEEILEDKQNSIDNKNQELTKLKIERKLKEITDRYIKQLNPFKKEILINRLKNKFFNNDNCKKNSKYMRLKYNLCSERIRQISEKEFYDYSKYIKNNLGLKNISISEIYDN